MLIILALAFWITAMIKAPDHLPWWVGFPSAGFFVLADIAHNIGKLTRDRERSNR